MADKQGIAPTEARQAEPEVPPDESAGTEPEAEPVESSKLESGAEPEERAAARSKTEAGCPIAVKFLGPRCCRRLHAAPAGVDEQPVCLMHSKDPSKQSGPLFDAFWLEFERILEKAGEGEAHFEKFVFPQLDFTRRTFKAICRFDGATFTQDSDFRGATFTQIAPFRGATFAQAADFFAVTFTEDADFIGATFKQNPHFRATFTQKAFFSRATFTKNANFFFATFTQDAYFAEATFTLDANFFGATFKQNATFTAATFTQRPDFERAEFHGTADWRHSRFLDRAEFRHTKFKPKEEGIPSAIFSLAKFAKPEEVVFDDVDLSRAIFLNCDPSEFWFTSSVRWAKRKGNRGLKVFEEDILLDPKLAKLQEEYGPIDHGAVEQIYHQLKKNYDARLDYRKANDFHFGEMEMRRLEVRTYPKLLKPWGWLRRWLGPEALYRWASNYGNGYVKPMLWLLGFLVLFAVLFPIPGLESGQPSPTPAENYLSVWNQQDTWTDNLWTEAKLVGDSLIASIDTAAFQRNPEYTPAYPWGRVLAILESLLTSTLFALFLLAIRRQFRR
jgi:hypothetical protein